MLGVQFTTDTNGKLLPVHPPKEDEIVSVPEIKRMQEKQQEARFRVLKKYKVTKLKQPNKVSPRPKKMTRFDITESSSCAKS